MSEQNEPPKENIVQAFKSLKKDDFVHMLYHPCFKESVVTSVLCGIGVGCIHLFMKAPPSKALNWGFGTYFGMSLVSWEGCNYRKQLETQNFNIQIQEAAQGVPKRRTSRPAENDSTDA
ncbi:hypothetical protein SPOG_00761 [Schizosaccharomyces cryophilus OY26]|uniref:Cytochrome c oxidase assembly protein COX20, mitochondrial n=1 Tax=Schizosaccharomyces cryophilus (strain OY26 / ATCC MYA-4695 / CBS 11777 / NBRC 106824 / NRRL Y48691) TaxID=653667 RepID=S9X0Z7_SCHCR|nr:uncharacterized protein SPOG_00761 [Schizosaccharomyces cryophilus OY26]EPY50697.1 hypothetical protein SPOG_00761 [Schizosaccharomyces cryophilus OY26]